MLKYWQVCIHYSDIKHLDKSLKYSVQIYNKFFFISGALFGSFFLGGGGGGGGGGELAYIEAEYAN